MSCSQKRVWGFDQTRRHVCHRNDGCCGTVLIIATGIVMVLTSAGVRGCSFVIVSAAGTAVG